jgi:hypothetical protein
MRSQYSKSNLRDAQCRFATALVVFCCGSGSQAGRQSVGEYTRQHLDYHVRSSLLSPEGEAANTQRRSISTLGTIGSVLLPPLSSDPNGAAAVLWLHETQREGNGNLKHLVVVGIGECRLLEHAHRCEGTGQLLEAASLHYNAGLLASHEGDITKATDYMDHAVSVVAALSPRTRESTLLQLDILCKLITRWTARGPEYTASAASLFGQTKEQLGELSLERQMIIIQCVKWTTAMPEMWQQRPYSAPIAAHLGEALRVMVQVEKSGVAQQSVATQTLYM